MSPPVVSSVTMLSGRSYHSVVTRPRSTQQKRQFLERPRPPLTPWPAVDGITAHALPHDRLRRRARQVRTCMTQCSALPLRHAAASGENTARRDSALCAPSPPRRRAGGESMAGVTSKPRGGQLALPAAEDDVGHRERDRSGQSRSAASQTLTAAPTFTSSTFQSLRTTTEPLRVVKAP